MDFLIEYAAKTIVSLSLSWSIKKTELNQQGSFINKN